MPRMTTKYFAEILKKLLLLKNKERIVPDEALRERLRERVATRAAGMKKPQRGASMAAVREKMVAMGGKMGAVREFFYRFRFAFGAVPAALVMVLVAVQLLKSPALDVNMDVTDEMDTANTLVMDVSEKKIVTFSGEDVLPAHLRRERKKEDVTENLALQSVGQEGSVLGNSVVAETTNAMVTAPSLLSTLPVATFTRAFLEEFLGLDVCPPLILEEFPLNTTGK